jgi:hypothetical protein
MYAATVVADHATEGAAAVGGGIGSIRKVVVLRGLAQSVKHYTRLYDREAGCRVEGREPVHVTREVEDYGNVGGLACHAGAGPAGKNGCADGAASGHGCLDIGGVARQNDAHGKLTVVGGIRCGECTRCQIELDLAAKRSFKTRLKLAMSCEALVIERCLAEEFGDLV